MGGAFQMSREIFEHPIWQDVTKFRIFFYIVGNAVFSEEGVRKGSVHIKRGQYLRSYRNLAKDLAYFDNNAEKEYSLSVLNRKIDELVEDGALQIQPTKLGTLFTVVNYQLYQGFDNYKAKSLEQRENTVGTPEEQPENNNKKVKKDNNVKKKEESSRKKKIAYEEHHMQLAELLRKGVIENNKYAGTINIESWANEMRIMMEHRKIEGKDLQDVILFTQNDPFWKTNIQSANKLKEKFKTLYAQMQQKREQTSSNVIPYRRGTSQERIANMMEGAKDFFEEEDEDDEKGNRGVADGN